MATITIKSACAIESPDTDLSDIDLHDSQAWKRTLPLLLVKLGRKLIEHGHHQDPANGAWISLSQVSKYCRRYNLRWSGGSIRAKNLELPIRDHFDREGEIRAGGVRIECDAKWNEAHRGKDIFLKFTRLYPDAIIS